MSTDSCNFSVVLCSHNGERFLKEQVDSIFHQEGGITSVHLHDFNSSDGTPNVIVALQAEYGDRLVVTRHEDAPGAKASFIRALHDTARTLPPGTLVFFADQDDVWLPEKLNVIRREIAARGLSRDEPFVLFHDVRVVDEALRMIRPTYYTGNPFHVPRDLDPSRLMMANPAIGHTMLLSMPLVCELIAWPDTANYLMHDWLAILIASRIGRVEHIPVALSLYRQHDNNVLGAYRSGRMPSFMRLLRLADSIIVQAVAFAHAIHTHHCCGGYKLPVSSPLEAPCRSGYRRAAGTLAIGAVIYGPTWQRKALGTLLLLRAIIGPASTRRHKTIERSRW